jgi:DNA-directed RNA polymerase specialized sigma24 family protein
VLQIEQASADWTEVVRKIRVGDESAVEELYAALSAGVRPTLLRSVETQSVEDRLHEILVIVLEAIQRGEVREPARLIGFVKTVARRRVVAHIRNAAFQRSRFVAVQNAEPLASFSRDPEWCAARVESVERTRRVLLHLTARDGEILERFYFKEEPPEQICREMQLTGTQFRLYKSRAIARCFHLAHPRPPVVILPRTA